MLTVGTCEIGWDHTRGGSEAICRPSDALASFPGAGFRCQWGSFEICFSGRTSVAERHSITGLPALFPPPSILSAYDPRHDLSARACSSRNPESNRESHPLPGAPL